MDLASNATAQNADASSIRPQPGDRLVFADGERHGNIISVADLQLGGPQVNAFPADPAGRLVRNGRASTRSSWFAPIPRRSTKKRGRRAVDGITAYSAICTHQGCEVTAWDVQMKALWCPCHDSKYDPRGGRVVGGPAPKRLAALPLKSVEGVLTVAAGFSGGGFQTR
jgi:Rieske Fe-S protein